MSTYDVSTVTDGLGDEEKRGEEGGKDGVHAAQHAGGDDPFLAGESDELPAPVFTGAQQDGQLDLRELHAVVVFGERGEEEVTLGRVRRNLR